MNTHGNKFSSSSQYSLSYTRNSPHLQNPIVQHAWRLSKSPPLFPIMSCVDPVYSFPNICLGYIVMLSSQAQTLDDISQLHEFQNKELSTFHLSHSRYMLPSYHQLSITI